MTGSRSAGFTLVELLVAVVAAGLLGTAVTALLVRQSRFYERNEARTRVRQGLRAAGDLLAAELRGTGPGDVIAAAPGSVSVRFDLLRAVVCDARPADGSTAVYVYDSVGGANLEPGFRGYALSDPGGSGWRVRDGASLATSAGSARTACVSRGAPDRPEAWRYRRVAGWRTAGGFDSLPAPGALLTRYGRLTYRLAPSGFDDGLGLWRNRQELISPFRGGSAFAYVLDDGTVRSGVGPADLGRVRGLRLRLEPAGGERGDPGRGPTRFSFWFQR